MEKGSRKEMEVPSAHTHTQIAGNGIEWKNEMNLLLDV